MKLSDAIRLGAMLKPQGRGGNSMASSSHDSCALGAALDAVGHVRGDQALVYTLVETEWPILRTRVALPAASSSWLMSMTEAVYVLNDCYYWTREEIADWVEQVENAQATEQPAVQCEVTA